jgi:hypothetical protein
MHTQTFAASPAVGKIYRCAFQGNVLYEAKIRKLEGCWATVEVIKALPGPHEHHYRPGQTFDIRHASYEFIE